MAIFQCMWTYFPIRIAWRAFKKPYMRDLFQNQWPRDLGVVPRHLKKKHIPWSSTISVVSTGCSFLCKFSECVLEHSVVLISLVPNLGLALCEVTDVQLEYSHVPVSSLLSKEQSGEYVQRGIIRFSWCIWHQHLALLQYLYWGNKINKSHKQTKWKSPSIEDSFIFEQALIQNVMPITGVIC